MKSLHFCTPNKLTEIQNNVKFETYRTGFIPGMYPGDLIKINKRTTKKAPHDDKQICLAHVFEIVPTMFRDLPMESREEIERYNRRFNQYHWFFKITLIKYQGGITQFL